MESSGRRSGLGRLLSLLTIEPMLFLKAFGMHIELGAAHTENLLIFKTCTTVFRYNASICDDLSNPANSHEQGDVLPYVNNFQLLNDYMEVPTSILFCLCMGGLADTFGCRPLFIFTLIGNVLYGLANLINFIFLDQLPLEFFYAKNVFFFFGGYSTFYMAFQAFAASTTKEDNRALRLSVFLGAENVSNLIAVALSPYLYDWAGYLGVYVTALACYVLAVGHVIFFVKDPVEEAAKASGKSKAISANQKPPLPKRLTRSVVTLFVEPFTDMMRTLWKRRPQHMHRIIFLSLLLNFLLYVNMGERSVTYYFLTRQFDHFDRSDYSWLNIYQTLLELFIMLTVVPLARKYRVNESLVMIAAFSLSTVGHLGAAFTNQLWQLYLARALFVEILNWLVGRAQLYNCLEEGEHGKIISVIYLMLAVSPLIGSTLFRKLYNATFEQFNGSFLLLSASIMLVGAIINLAIYTQRDHMSEHGRLRALRMKKLAADDEDEERKKGTESSTQF